MWYSFVQKISHGNKMCQAVNLKKVGPTILVVHQSSTLLFSYYYYFIYYQSSPTQNGCNLLELEAVIILFR